MSVVVNKSKAAACQRNFAVALETPPHPLKLGQCGDDGISRHADFQPNCDGSQRIQHVMQACQIQRDVQIHRHAVVAAQRR